MKDDRIFELLLKRVEAHISDAEQKELETWMQTSEANRLEGEKIMKALLAGRKPPDHIHIDLDSEYSALKSKMGKSRRIAPYWRIAAAVLIALGVVWLVRDFTTYKSSTEIYAGPQDAIPLQDGSTIWLREGSTFEIAFLESSRRATMEGQGYFEVTPDLTKSFEIETTLGTITVVGTAFEVLSSQDSLRVTVSEGQVRLSAEEASVILAAGEVGVVLSGAIQKKRANKPAGAWHIEPLRFEQAALGEVLAAIENYYVINFISNNQEVLDCRLNMVLDFPPLEEVLLTLETLLNIDVNLISDGNYSVLGDGCQ